MKSMARQAWDAECAQRMTGAFRSRQQLLTQASRQIMEDYPIIPLLQYSLPRLVKSYVGGYSTENQMDRFRTQDLYIIKH